MTTFGVAAFSNSTGQIPENGFGAPPGLNGCRTCHISKDGLSTLLRIAKVRIGFNQRLLPHGIIVQQVPGWFIAKVRLFRIARFTESDVESAALSWLESLGCTILSGPDIAPGELAQERESYEQPVLPQRLRDAERFISEVVLLTRSICLSRLEELREWSQ